MIEITDFEEVTRFKMSRALDGKPVYWVAAYLVDGLLIDTGCSHTAGEFADCLEGQSLNIVVNTHHHEDHVGANRTMIERFGIPILAHPDSVPLIGRVPVLRPYQEYVWGYPEPAEVSVLGKEVLTERFHFDVLETPGHCEGHVALVELGRGWCFSGDIFISERPKVIRADEDVAGLMSSMRLLAALPTERLVLFTSMGEIIPDGRRALLSCLEYLEGLQKKARELEAQGFTPEEIRERLFGEGSSLATLTGGHFSSGNLVKSLLAETTMKSE
ncbi:MAG: MBL fold metallo-hydrolase [Actinomycetota bacterium]|nr:MBL fold metallo-hydrolase [Actinomycetota bacterium]